MKMRGVLKVVVAVAAVQLASLSPRRVGAWIWGSTGAVTRSGHKTGAAANSVIYCAHSTTSTSCPNCVECWTAGVMQSRHMGESSSTRTQSLRTDAADAKLLRASQTEESSGLPQAIITAIICPLSSLRRPCKLRPSR